MCLGEIHEKEWIKTCDWLPKLAFAGCKRTDIVWGNWNRRVKPEGVFLVL
jgi:hypothetical protein